MEEVAEDASAFEVPAPEIEGYTILDKLGEAGQGQVWRAIQGRPFRTDLAIKRNTRR